MDAARSTFETKTSGIVEKSGIWSEFPCHCGNLSGSSTAANVFFGCLAIDEKDTKAMVKLLKENERSGRVRS
jgi:hypothetical protein